MRPANSETLFEIRRFVKRDDRQCQFRITRANCFNQILITWQKHIGFAKYMMEHPHDADGCQHVGAAAGSLSLRSIASSRVAAVENRTISIT